MIEGLTI